RVQHRQRRQPDADRSDLRRRRPGHRRDRTGGALGRDERMTMPTAHPTQLDDRLANAELGARVKVCGITEPSEIDLLARQQVDFVGLWYGVPGGPADLPLESWRPLAEAAAATGTLAPVLVTFLKDADALKGALDGAPVHWVQLHGYPTP